MSAVERVVLFALLAWGGVRRADAEEPAPPAGPTAATDRSLEKGLETLSLRMRAKILEAEILRSAGKLEEARAAAREVEPMYVEGLTELRRLTATARPAGPPPDDAADLLEDYGPFDALGESPFRLRGRIHHGHGGGRPIWLDASRHGMRWLTAMQSPDGRFEADGFGRWCDGKPNTHPASARPDGVGHPGLSLLCTAGAVCAFLGCGYTHLGDNEFARHVARAIAALRRAQQPDGCVGPRNSEGWPETHALATLALVEVYGCTGSRAIKPAAQRALDFLVSLRTQDGGWPRTRWAEGAVLATAWQALPVLSAWAINAGAAKAGLPPLLRLDAAALTGLSSWLARHTDPATGVLSDPPEQRVNAHGAHFTGQRQTAAGVLLRLMLGDDPAHDAGLARSLALLAAHPPRGDPAAASMDLEYLLFGSLAAAQAGKETWKTWASVVHGRPFLDAQRQDTNYCIAKGSWPATDPRFAEAGRVLATALLTRVVEAQSLYALK